MRELFSRRLRSELRALTAGEATGSVLEIGVGRGLNIPFYRSAQELVGLDHDHAQLRRAAAAVASARVPVRLRAGNAESLPFPDRAFDSVVLSYVLCSVDDPEAVLREAARVLRPGGVLLYLEHVRATSRFGGWMLDAITPLYSRLDRGCHPNRASVESIAHHFVIEDGWRRRLLARGRARLRVRDEPGRNGS